MSLACELQIVSNTQSPGSSPSTPAVDPGPQQPSSPCRLYVISFVQDHEGGGKYGPTRPVFPVDYAVELDTMGSYLRANGLPVVSDRGIRRTSLGTECEPEPMDPVAEELFQLAKEEFPPPEEALEVRLVPGEDWRVMQGDGGPSGKRFRALVMLRKS